MANSPSKGIKRSGSKEAILSKHGFKTTKVISSRMKKIRSKGTKPEVKLQKSLWARGYRYRKHPSALPGRPEVAFIRQKIAVFVDGVFWHGYNWEARKQKIQKNRDYWVPKIERNMARDRLQNQQLEEMGWVVLRFWEHEVEADSSGCVQKIEKAFEAREGQ